MARIIVTRPAQQAAPWVEGLSALGHAVQALALMDIDEISSAQDRHALAQALSRLQDYRALMLVSTAAVNAFFSACAQPGAGSVSAKQLAALYPHLRCWVTGPGTRASLLAWQWPDARIDSPEPGCAQFDSEALWDCVKGQVDGGFRLLVLCGREGDSPALGRTWLAQQLHWHGGHADALAVYVRRAPIWSDAQHSQIQQWLRDGSVWLLSSSQAVRNLVQVADVGQASCICTHERIAQVARASGFAVVCTSRPTLGDIAASIKSIYE